MRIGIMGGTFNPIHNAHLIISQFALDEFGLDKIWFMTNGSPPHKHDKSILPSKMRHEMVCLAIEDNENFSGFDYEIKKDEYSYTANTLLELKELYPEYEFFFIIGGDSLHDFGKWFKPNEIARLCNILVFERAGYEYDILKDIQNVKSEYNANVYQIHAPLFELSSSTIRKRVLEGKSIRYLLPDSVVEYIEKNKLYKE